MTRACYLIFFGEYRGHGHPHESPASMKVPLQILGVLSIVVGLIGTGLVGDKLRFSHWVRFDVPGAPDIVAEHAFNFPLATLSVALALVGIGLACAYYLRGVLKGAMARNGLLRTGYRVLLNKYYLDALFIDGVIRSIQYPIAKAAYWINQNVIDGVVNNLGVGAVEAAHLTYDYIDQKVIDGAVNGAGFTAEEGGVLLRHTQTGRVQQYAAFLFGAAALLALILVFVT
jgi:NADH-quinone oxidoreductase subunit L